MAGTKKKIGELTVLIEPSGRGLKGSLYYEGGPIPIHCGACGAVVYRGVPISWE